MKYEKLIHEEENLVRPGGDAPENENPEPVAERPGDGQPEDDQNDPDGEKPAKDNLPEA